MQEGEIKPIADELQDFLNAKSDDDSECVANWRPRLTQCSLHEGSHLPCTLGR